MSHLTLLVAWLTFSAAASRPGTAASLLSSLGSVEDKMSGVWALLGQPPAKPTNARAGNNNNNNNNNNHNNHNNNHMLDR